MVVGQSEASAERPDQIAGQARNDTGWWSEVTVARPVRWKNRLGEKRLRPTYAGVSAERQTLRPRTTTAMRTTAPRSRQGARPARQVPRTVTIRSGGGRAFCGGDPEEADTSMAIAGRGGNDEGAKHDAL